MVVRLNENGSRNASNEMKMNDTAPEMKPWSKQHFLHIPGAQNANVLKFM